MTNPPLVHLAAGSRVDGSLYAEAACGVSCRTSGLSHAFSPVARLYITVVTRSVTCPTCRRPRT